MQTHGHFVRTWVSRHDNGWEAWVGEDEHGDFHAWACPTGAAMATAATVEDTETHGKVAALLALQEETGHQCAHHCNDWKEYTGC